MNTKFVKEYLTNVKWSNNQTWQVEGNIEKLSNQYYKFDIYYISDFPGNKKVKLINSKSQADKVLFEDSQNWILIDTREMVKYMKKHSLKEVLLEELIKKIDWNIILPKK